MNNINLTGRVGRDPEMRYFESGKVLTELSLAVSRISKNKEGQYETDWFDCCFWGKQAELVGERVKKGHMLGVTGRLEIDKWTKEDGTKGTKVKVQVSSVDLLTPKEEGSQPAGTASKPAAKPPAKPPASKAAPQEDLEGVFASEDEIPF